MITLSFNRNLQTLGKKDFILTDAEGNEEPIKINQLVAQALVDSKKGEAIKYLNWAITLFAGESITVDDADFKKIYELVDNSENFKLLVRGQVLIMMDEAKDESKKPKIVESVPVAEKAA